MIEAVTICLLGEPVPFARTRIAKGGVLFTPAKQRNAAAALKYAAQEPMRGRQPFDAPVAIDLVAEMPIPASWSKRKRDRAARGEIRPGIKPDFDNITKLVGDALNGIVWADDRLIVDARVRKLYGAQPKIVIRVWPAQDAILTVDESGVADLK